MRKLYDAIDRFCALHPRLGVPHLMRYIVACNAVIYILSLFDRSGLLLNTLAMDPASVLHGQIWRVVTYVLIPTGGGVWLLVSLFFYYWLGETLENMWGATRFTVYYVSGMLLTAIAAIIAYFIDGISWPLYGASYVNTALFMAYALTYPDAMVRLYFIIPIKMKWLAVVEAVLYAINIVRYAVAGLWGLALLPIVALLNLFVFFSPEFYRRADTVRAHNRKEAVEFRKAVKEQKKNRGYNHKCEICGRTDTDFPDLQFRYCSKCSGYHCFCQDHIFNHTHHTE